MPETAIPFTVGDETAPEFDNFEAVLYSAGTKDQMIKINFGEKMALEGKYAVNDAEKYQIDGKALKDYKDYEIKAVDDGKVVEIYIPVEKDNTGEVTKNKEIPVKDDTILLARVADAAGNYTEKLSDNIKFKSEGTIANAKDGDAYIVQATAVDTIKIKFDDNVAKFDINDIVIYKKATVGEAVYNAVYNKEEIAGVETELDGGKTVVYIKTAEDMPYDIEDYLYVHVVGNESENVYKEKLAKNTVAVQDKIAPKVKKPSDDIEFTTANTITIKFTEKLDSDYAEQIAHDLVVMGRDGKALVALDHYTTSLSASGDTVIVTITEVDEKYGIQKYSIKSKDTVNFIRDMKGNTAETFKEVKN